MTQKPKRLAKIWREIKRPFGKLYRRIKRPNTKPCHPEKDYSLHSGERQVGQTLNEIRSDHLKRYELVVTTIQNEFGVNPTHGIDVFCGTGYGSFLIATSVPSTTIMGIDGSHDAIEFAKQHYNHERVSYECKLFPFPIEKKTYDYAVCFESIEHVKDDQAFLRVLLDSLKFDGLLFFSVPNAEKLDADQNPFHFRHYTHQDVEVLAKDFGLEFISVFGQDTYAMENKIATGILEYEKMNLIKDGHGQFLIYIFRNKKSV